MIFWLFRLPVAAAAAGCFVSGMILSVLGSSGTELLLAAQLIMGSLTALAVVAGPRVGA
jgi:hypothetical protein